MRSLLPLLALAALSLLVACPADDGAEGEGEGEGEPAGGEGEGEGEGEGDAGEGEGEGEGDAGEGEGEGDVGEGEGEGDVGEGEGEGEVPGARGSACVVDDDCDDRLSCLFDSRAADLQTRCGPTPLFGASDGDACDDDADCARRLCLDGQCARPCLDDGGCGTDTTVCQAVDVVLGAAPATSAGTFDVCVCAADHSGAGCATCDAGLQDNDDDGSCLATCDAAIAGGALVCELGDRCEDDSGTAVCVSPPLSSCGAILRADPAALSGRYVIDVDEEGPLEPIETACDMDFDGGGWTLVMSTGFEGPDFVPVAPPTVGVTSRLDSATAGVLAAASTEVHIRASGEATARSITTRPGSLPSQRFAEGRVLIVFEFEFNPADWRATPGLEGTIPPTGCDAQTFGYPSIHHACGNSVGLHLFGDQARFVFDTGLNENLEVWVRDGAIPTSCADVVADDPGAPSGSYFVNDGVVAGYVFCDFG